jgi:ATP-binding cassette subfamily F protein 3
VQSRVKALQKMEQHEALSTINNLSFMFSQKPFSAPSLGRTKDLSFRYPDGPLLIQGLSITISKDARIGIIGKNGRGKSTLLKLLAQEIKPLEGLVALHEATSIGYFGQTNISRLNDLKRIEEEIQDANPMLSRTKIRAICGAMLFGGDSGDKKIGVLSGGEKSRVLLGRILATPVNLLLLDEPTSHLDMESIEALIDALKSFSGGIAVVTHSETVLRALCTSLIVFTSNGAEFFPGSYDEFLSQKGWGADEQECISPSKSNSPIKQKKDKNDEKKSLNPLKRKQLEAEFSSLDKLLKNNTQDIEKAGLEGDFELLQHLSDDREKYETRQLEILDLLAE